jgi:RNA polymerase sigma-70 factor (ECF subfamily)
VNLVLTSARGEQRRHQHEEQDVGQGHETMADIEGSRGYVRPASVHEAIDLERAIAGLPPGARAVFVLHDVEGYQHDEIATLTGTAEGTCRAQLHRARKLLMEALNR